MKPLTQSERRWLVFALRLAIAWEDSLADANTPDPIYGKPDGYFLKNIRNCRSNIRKFEKLKERLSS